MQSSRELHPYVTECDRSLSGAASVRCIVVSEVDYGSWAVEGIDLPACLLFPAQQTRVLWAALDGIAPEPDLRMPLSPHQPRSVA
jgi:hypothetical protein